MIDRIFVTRKLAALAFFAASLAADPLNAQAPAITPPARPPAAAKPQNPTPAPRPAAGMPVVAPPTRGGQQPDIAYGAYQRGYFLTAFAEATRRAGEKNDARAMTLLGELYSNGFGVPLDELVGTGPSGRITMCPTSPAKESAPR